MNRSTLILPALLLTYIALNISGFSLSRFRFLSDDALLRLVITDIIGRDEHFDRNDMHYAGVDDFLARNPHCCSVRGGIITSPELAHEGDWLNWLWHRRAVAVCYQRHESGDASHYSLTTFRDNAGADLDTYGMEGPSC